jgi:hypothetical protein
VPLKSIENSKGKVSIEEWTHMKIKTGSGIIEKNKIRRGGEKSREKRCVEYSAIGCKVTATFIIFFKMCMREGV